MSSYWICLIFVNGDYTVTPRVRSANGFREKTPGRLSITSGAQVKPQRIALRIYCVVQVHPYSFDRNLGLINPPRICCHFEMGLASLLDFGGVALYPAIDGHMIDVQTLSCMISSRSR